MGIAAPLPPLRKTRSPLTRNRKPVAIPARKGLGDFPGIPFGHPQNTLTLFPFLSPSSSRGYPLSLLRLVPAVGPLLFFFFAFASWTTTDRARSSRPRRQPGAAWRRFWSPSAPRKTRFLRNPFVPEATLKSREPTVRVQIGLGLHLPVQLVFVLCGRRGRPRDLLILEAPWFS